MKIILLQDEKKLGKKGDIIEASEGYARNYILPKKIGVEASSKNLNDLKLHKANEEKVAQENLDAAKALATELETKQVVVKIKAGEGGRTFGSVSSKEIATACKEQHGIEIDKKKIQLPESLKNFGSYEVTVKLHPQVAAKLTVKVTDPMPAMDENVIKRIMPHSLEAEQSVIGSMFIDAEAIAAATEQISGEDFYNRQYGVVFDTIVELNNEGKPIDFVTLQDRLRSKEDVPPEVSGLDFLTNLIAAVPTSANIKYYAGIVAEKATLRRLIRTNEEIANTCYSGKESLDTILESTESKINEVVQKKNVKEFVPIRTVVMNAMDKIEKASKLHGTVTGIATGFIDLDYRTAGMQPSDLVLIAARPSMGKTAFVLNIAQHVAFKQNLPVAIFSLEMSKEQLINRMFSLEPSVDAQKLRTGQLNDQEWERLIESAGVIGKSKLMIDDTPGISIAELRSKCRRMKQENGLSMIIIDYLQLMSGSGGRSSDSRQQEISDISRSLKAVARELSVPVLALSQLSRAVEQRPDHRPMLSDLRESGAIEQDADVVMFIYRDDYYNHDSPDKGISEIIIAKQRNGPIGTVQLAWLPEYTKFANLENDRKKDF